MQAGAIEKGRRKGLALGSDVKSSSDPDSLCAVVLRVTKDGGAISSSASCGTWGYPLLSGLEGDESWWGSANPSGRIGWL